MLLLSIMKLLLIGIRRPGFDFKLCSVLLLEANEL